MTMERLPEHPGIRAALRTGYPNGYDPGLFTTCDWCGEEIFIGDDYYDIHGEILCAECVGDCRKEARSA